MKQIFAAAALAFLPACATTPPPEACTAAWFEYKTDEVLKPFAREHRGLIKDLRSLDGKIDKPGPFTMIRMASLADDLMEVATDFEDDIVPELRSAADTCGTDPKLVTAFTDMLRDEGVDGQVLAWVEGLGIIMMREMERGKDGA